MVVAQVYIQVKSEYVNEFITASKDNAQSSLQEDGIKHLKSFNPLKIRAFLFL